jgi:hypothetical protein
MEFARLMVTVDLSPTAADRIPTREWPCQAMGGPAYRLRGKRDQSPEFCTGTAAGPTRS